MAKNTVVQVGKPGGEFELVENEQITGVTRDGGYQQNMILRHEAVALMTEWILLTRVRYCAQGSRHSMRCGTAELCRESWWGCKASADWDIWGYSSPRNSGIAWWAWDAGRRMPRWRRS